MDFELFHAIQKVRDSKLHIILEKVPEWASINETKSKNIKIAIIDLETTGLNYKIDKITEIGLIKFSIVDNRLLNVITTYSDLQDPGVTISEKITALTGINNDMVKGRDIDWGLINNILKDCNVILCHNADFDRKFLELATDKVNFSKIKFGCTKNDIDWTERGYGSNKLDYINWKLGYWYDGHRAINDCWATLNILNAEKGALKELLVNVDKTTYKVYAVNAPYDKKDILKDNGFYWNDGLDNNPKAWFKITDDYNVVEIWLKENKIQCSNHIVKLTAFNRYSERV